MLMQCLVVLNFSRLNFCLDRFLKAILEKFLMNSICSGALQLASPLNIYCPPPEKSSGGGAKNHALRARGSFFASP